MSYRILSASLALTIVLMACPQPAIAYTDPGSGALIFQTLYAACIAGSFYFRRLLDRFFGRRK